MKKSDAVAFALAMILATPPTAQAREYRGQVPHLRSPEHCILPYRGVPVKLDPALIQEAESAGDQSELLVDLRIRNSTPGWDIDADDAFTSFLRAKPEGGEVVTRFLGLRVVNNSSITEDGRVTLTLLTVKASLEQLYHALRDDTLAVESRGFPAARGRSYRTRLFQIVSASPHQAATEAK